MALAIDTCCEFSEYNQEDGVYYHDLIYSIACHICQKYTEPVEEDACTVFLQFVISNNDYDINKK
jgi:hypothetical protein